MSTGRAFARGIDSIEPAMQPDGHIVHLKRGRRVVRLWPDRPLDVFDLPTIATPLRLPSREDLQPRLHLLELHVDRRSTPRSVTLVRDIVQQLQQALPQAILFIRVACV